MNRKDPSSVKELANDAVNTPAGDANNMVKEPANDAMNAQAGDANNLAKEPGSGRKNHRRVAWIAALAGVLVVALLVCLFFPKLFGKKNDMKNTGSDQEKMEAVAGSNGVNDNSDASKNGVNDNSDAGINGTETTMSKAMRTHLLASPVYPDIPMNADLIDDQASDESMDQYTIWREAITELRAQPEGYEDAYVEYCKSVIPILLSDTGNKNRVASPLSLYLALGMMAEISDGNTRAQLLQALAESDIEELRAHTQSLWLANYMDDGFSKLVLANSLWMNDNKEYKQEVLDILATKYFAASFSGDPAEEEYSKVFREWVNAQTDDLLNDMVDDLELDPNMVLALASTVNYSAKWTDKFNPDENRHGAFHAAEGDVECEYMYNGSVWDYHKGETFSAVQLSTLYNGRVRFILPKEGMTPEELLGEEEVIEFLCNGDLMIAVGEEEEELAARFTVPKFDVETEIDLKPVMEDLGITDAMDQGSSDFSPLTLESNGVYISSAKQDTRVMIDEEGCKAVSLTVVLMGAGGPEKFVDFTLDRPFIFEIVSETGLPIFVGIVNDPS
ncbi:MAG: hypothetical protein J5379_08285 [Clostridiales bacterium]|nr:hypothetical protein [Clostridiales bacterium]